MIHFLKYKRAQAAIEYLFIVGFALLFVIPIILLFYTQRADISDEIVFAQINRLGLELENAIDNVYYLGAPSKQTIKIYVPESIDSVFVASNSITFTFDTVAFGLYNYSIYPDVNLTGSIYAHGGINNFVVEATEWAVKVTN